MHYYYKIKPVTLPTNSSDSTISNRIYQGRIKKYSRHPFHLDAVKYRQELFDILKPLADALGLNIDELGRIR